MAHEPKSCGKKLKNCQDCLGVGKFRTLEGKTDCPNCNGTGHVFVGECPAEPKNCRTCGKPPCSMIRPWGCDLDQTVGHDYWGERDKCHGDCSPRPKPERAAAEPKLAVAWQAGFDTAYEGRLNAKNPYEKQP